MKIRRSSFSVLLLFFSALTVSAPGQDYNFGPAKDSLAKLSQLQAAISASRGKIGGLFFGPGHIEVKCGFDCFIGICLKEQRFTYDVTFAAWKPTFDRVLANQQQRNVSFTGGYQAQFQSWVGTVNDINADLQSISAQVTALQVNIGSLSPDALATARGEVKSQLSSVAAKIDASSNQAQRMMQQVALYLQTQTNNQNVLAQQKDSFQSTVNTEMSRVRQFIDQQPCSGNAWDQFDGFKSKINGSIDSTGETINNLRASALASDQAGSVLVGSMVNMANRMSLVTAQLAQAQTAQDTNAAIASLRVTVAAQAWKDFATYANLQNTN